METVIGYILLLDTPRTTSYIRGECWFFGAAFDLTKFLQLGGKLESPAGMLKGKQTSILKQNYYCM